MQFLIPVITAAAAIFLTSPAWAFTNTLKPVSAKPSETVSPGAVKLVRSRLSGREQLERLLRTHHTAHPITRKVRDAIGDPDIVIVDHRGRPGTTYRCSFLYRANQRVFICD